MNHDRHYEKSRTNSDSHDRQGDRSKQSNHAQHGGHDKHAGHSPEMFKRRFFICLLLTLPVLYFAPMFEHWFNYQTIQFPGVNWITPILSTIIYFYGGWVKLA
jgi:P-type Cu2+ transporter